jgi:MFS family permease
MTTPPRTAVRRLALARVISLSGGAAAFAALNYAIYQETRSPTWVAAALFLTFGTVGFASLFAGALGDRFDRQKLMILSDLAGAACFGVMAFVDDPGWLLAVAFLSALAEAPFLASSSAAIPNLVEDEDQIGWANGLVGISRNAGILLGPLIGGVLVGTLGAGFVFGLNAVSFVVSALIVGSVHASFSQARKGEDEQEHTGVLAGLRFVKRDRILRAVALAWIPIALGLGMTMVADVPLVELFGAGGVGYGILIACWAGGSIIGSLLGRYLTRRTEPIAFVAGAGVVALSGILTGLSPWFWGVLVAIFVMGIGDGTQVVSQQGIMQRRTPDAVRSRVAAALDAVAHISLAISYAVAGPVVAWLGPRGTYVLGGLVGLLAVVFAYPALELRREPETASGAAGDGDGPGRDDGGSGRRRGGGSQDDAAGVVLGYSAGDTETTASTR